MANFLKNITGVFTSAKNESVIGIDIGSSSIKVVELKRKGAQAVLETYGELSLGPYAGVSVGVATSLTPEKITEALHDLLTEKEVNIQSKLAGIAIPFSSSLMTVIEMPDVGPKELADMVPIEARKYIPVPISEVTIDWSLIPKSTTEVGQEEEPAPWSPGQPTDGLANKFNAQKKKLPTVDVLVVAIHKETLTRFADIAQKNDLDTGFFEIEIFSTMRSVIEDTLEPVMIFDMGAASTKLFIVERGILKVSHTINRGGQNITKAIAQSFGIAEDKAEVMKRQQGMLETTDEGQNIARVAMLSLEYIFEEANHVVVDFEKKYNRAVSKVIMIGGGSSLKGLNEVAQKGFQTPVISGDPFGKVVTPAFLEEVLRQTGPQFAVAVGLALRRLQEL